jgi:hypothetical protein
MKGLVRHALHGNSHVRLHMQCALSNFASHCMPYATIIHAENSRRAERPVFSSSFLLLSFSPMSYHSPSSAVKVMGDWGSVCLVVLGTQAIK